MPAQPQLILFLDETGCLKAEVPSLNGIRRKLELPEGSELIAIRAELMAQRDRIKIQAEINAAKLKEEVFQRSRRVRKELTQTHGPMFADKILGEKWERKNNQPFNPVLAKELVL